MFGRFGRSPALREFDTAMRAVDLHPNLVPEAVKLTATKLLGEQAGDGEISPQSYADAAALLAYCMLGADTFAEANGEDLTSGVERRIEAALDADGSLDAQLVLLVLAAKLVQPSVAQAFQFESDQA
jgi:hypothetical protein